MADHVTSDMRGDPLSLVLLRRAGDGDGHVNLEVHFVIRRCVPSP